MNVSEFLTITAAIVPDREALVFEGRRTTYESLQERADRLASALAGLGVGAGDRVATLQVNCPELVETVFSTAKLDAIYVPLNFRAKADELTAMLNNAEPTVLLVGQRYVELVEAVLPSATGLQHVVALEAPHGDWPFYDDLLAGTEPGEHAPMADEEELAVLMFTAGTTGTPKAVMLSHNSFSSYTLANVEPADPEVEEKNILTVPMYHIAGLQAVMAAVYGGRTLVVQRQFEPQAWMGLVEEEGVQRAMMVPTMIKQLMDHPDFARFDRSSLQVITYGAAPMPLEVIRRALAEFPGCRFINAFGQTETASTITMLPPEDHDIPADLPEEERERRLARLTSIGRPLPDVEVRIVDEAGADVPTGGVGEIVARGARLMKGYWRSEAGTQEVVRGGWLYTGDLGYWDEEGYIYLAGRAKDTIKRGGEMISPEEVEGVLRTHPAVDDASVIGVPDVEWGEQVRAVVTLRPNAPRPNESELVEHCRSRLASFKKPETVVFVDELPRNALGKVLKRVLREEYGGAEVRPESS